MSTNIYSVGDRARLGPKGRGESSAHPCAVEISSEIAGAIISYRQMVPLVIGNCAGPDIVSGAVVEADLAVGQEKVTVVADGDDCFPGAVSGIVDPSHERIGEDG